jgi:hypothetical protein
MVSENGMLRAVFVSGTEEYKEAWRKLQHDGLHNLYSSQKVV